MAAVVAVGLLSSATAAQAWKQLDYELLVAVRRGEVAAVKDALARGADVNAVSLSGPGVGTQPCGRRRPH